MDEAFEDEIRELLASGNKIAAVKRYREEAGVGLAEAKTAVESLEAIGSFTQSVAPMDDPELTQQIVSLLGRGEKIDAVKLYRDRFRVDSRMRKKRLSKSANKTAFQHHPGMAVWGSSSSWLQRSGGAAAEMIDKILGSPKDTQRTPA